MMKQQQGAVLLVSLVMLLVITVIAVASLSTGTLETKMVVNVVQKETSFQEAESAVDETIEDPTHLYNAWVLGRNNPNLPMQSAAKQHSVPITSHSSYANSSATAEFLSSKPSIGGDSITIGSGVSMRVYSYEVRGTASLDNATVDTVVGQGVDFKTREFDY